MEMISRRSVSLPAELEDQVIELRKTDRFCKCSISEIVRQLIELGLSATSNSKEPKTDG